MTLYLPDGNGGLQPISDSVPTGATAPPGQLPQRWTAPTLDETIVMGSREAVLLPVTRGGIEIIAGIEVALTQYGYDPVWQPTSTSGLGHAYFTVDRLRRGRYHVTARHQPTGVVLKAGIVRII